MRAIRNLTAGLLTLLSVSCAPTSMSASGPFTGDYSTDPGFYTTSGLHVGFLTDCYDAVEKSLTTRGVQLETLYQGDDSRIMTSASGSQAVVYASCQKSSETSFKLTVTGNNLHVVTTPQAYISGKNKQNSCQYKEGADKNLKDCPDAFMTAYGSPSRASVANGSSSSSSGSTVNKAPDVNLGDVLSFFAAVLPAVANVIGNSSGTSGSSNNYSAPASTPTYIPLVTYTPPATSSYNPAPTNPSKPNSSGDTGSDNSFIYDKKDYSNCFTQAVAKSEYGTFTNSITNRCNIQLDAFWCWEGTTGEIVHACGFNGDFYQGSSVIMPGETFDLGGNSKNQSRKYHLASCNNTDGYLWYQDSGDYKTGMYSCRKLR